MLDNSDMIARNCATFKGKCDALRELEMRILADGIDIPKEIKVILDDMIATEDNRYTLYQHQYIDAIGGNEALKV